ncbi:hypothetical protein [Roseivirga sp.]|uniref:hypothetical protein n=1 Tax=Roseivirga sp. TaxID=1964215 RepID=UPI003B515ABA
MLKSFTSSRFSIILVGFIFLSSCSGSHSPLKSAERELNKLVYDLSLTETELQNVYENHFHVQPDRQALAIELLSEMRNTLLQQKVFINSIVELDSNSEFNQNMISFARDMNIQVVYMAQFNNQDFKIYFSLNDSKLVLFIPMNNGQKGIITF